MKHNVDKIQCVTSCTDAKNRDFSAVVLIVFVAEVDFSFFKGQQHLSVNNTMDKSDKSDHPHHSYLALSNITKPIVCIFYICIFRPEDIYILARRYMLRCHEVLTMVRRMPKN